MTGWHLELLHAPALRVDLRAVVPAALAGLTAVQIERLPLGHGRASLALGELFRVTPAEPGTLRLSGELGRVDRIGWQMASGRILVEGPVGDYAGACMIGGELVVRSDAGALAACEMAGGAVRIEGDVGDFAGSTLPGSMDGMRGGSLVITGRAGARLGDRMRRGTVVVFGDAGDFAASRMVAGTIAIGGRCGAHVGHGMRRGSLVVAGPRPVIGPTFVPAIADAPVFWQLLARDLARHGGVFADLPARRIERHLGDLGSAGKGELICTA